MVDFGLQIDVLIHNNKQNPIAPEVLKHNKKVSLRHKY